MLTQFKLIILLIKATNQKPMSKKCNSLQIKVLNELCRFVTVYCFIKIF